MKSYGLYESASVKVGEITFLPIILTRCLDRFKHSKRPSRYALNTPLRILADQFQAARMLLRVDDVVQATRKEKQQEQGPPPEEMMEG